MLLALWPQFPYIAEKGPVAEQRYFESNAKEAYRWPE